MTTPALAQDHRIDTELAERFQALALDCVHQEYPNKISHVLLEDEDARPPSELTPVFYGCFDWHSSVHGHWLLTRLLHVAPESARSEEAAAALAESFTDPKVAGELAYIAPEDRDGFERPYGWAWFLQLTTELREWDDPRAEEWLQTLVPLEQQIVTRLKDWLPKLAYPIRLGTHNQSMFAFSLMLDYARAAGYKELETMLVERSLAFHENDENCPLAYEPSGEDFLSPCLQEADLMRRVLPQDEFTAWLSDFLPDIPEDGSADWLEPGVVNDPTDGKLVHLDGVNLSRAWNLEGVASALPEDDPRIPALRAAAERHKESGLASVTGDHYAGGHWLASFATYLMTKRGVEQTP